ncbi:MAG: hypothetical protein PHT99_11110 [Methanoregula sp.]|nr:hypothetical protein [Methanoregula sp.]
MVRSRRKKKSLFGKVVTGIFIVTILWLVIVFAFPFFEGWIYLKFFLICMVGLAFLGITYMIRS